MNLSKVPKRGYSSPVRAQGAGETRSRILASARALFSDKGVDAVTIAEIARKSGVSASTVFAVFRSKEGMLRSLMEEALFGDEYKSAQRLLAGVDDPVEAIALTARVARSIYEGECRELGSLRNQSGSSPALREVEEEFEQTRYALQHERVSRLFSSGRAKSGLSEVEARRILWMYTSRNVYRMLVTGGGWTHDRYEDWLSQTLVETLTSRP